MVNRIQLIREFASEIARTRVVISSRRDDWGMSLSDLYKGIPRLILPRNLNQNDEGDKAFRKFFISCYPSAQGFSNVTISLLHEMGHWFHPQEYLESDPDEYAQATGWWHFTLPCEMVATNWAIAWLQDPENRKKAKAFEREFFKYGKR